MRWKKFLAEEIIKRYHDKVSAKIEREWFENTFSRKITPEDIPILEVDCPQWVAIDLVKKFFNDSKSNSDVRRLFQQGAVSVNSVKISAFDARVEVSTDDVVKVGKRAWFKIKITNS